YRSQILGEEMQLIEVQPKHLSPARLINAIRMLGFGEETMIEATADGKLLVRAFNDAAADITKLLQAVDVAPARQDDFAPVLLVWTPRQRSARELESAIKPLFDVKTHIDEA